MNKLERYLMERRRKRDRLFYCAAAGAIVALIIYSVLSRLLAE